MQSIEIATDEYLRLFFGLISRKLQKINVDFCIGVETISIELTRRNHPIPFSFSHRRTLTFSFGVKPLLLLLMSYDMGLL